MAESCLLYYITDRTTLATDEPSRRCRLLGKISEAACAGVDYIQLREKDLPTRDLESLAREAVKIIAQLRTENRELRTALLINSRADVALAVGADGVQLRGDDVSAREVRAVWKRSSARENSLQSPIIGVSCHSPAEVASAASFGATFAVFAPVFEKKDSRPAGIKLLQQACLANIPVLALGGITPGNARSCFEAGAAGVAGIRLFQGNDIVSIVKQLRG